MSPIWKTDGRRSAPRIDVEALCWECLDGGETSSIIVDLGAAGARIERPFVGGRSPREVPLQLEVPGIDEVMWARGEVCFDQVVAAPSATTGGPFGLIRRTGYRIAVAARRDLKLLRELVFDTHATIERLAAADRRLAIADSYR
jgi:hypothetical protein